MKRLCWLLVVIAAFSVASSTRDHAVRQANDRPFENLIFSATAADNLALLFSQFDTELVLCLEG